MQCSACGHVNPEDSRFCGECAASLEAALVCPACGQENSTGQKFCNGCAQPLGATNRAGASESSSRFPTSIPKPTPLPGPVGGGRYRIERFLGEGARKRVYLAHDTRLASDVALALIKTEGLDSEGRVRVRREAQAMGRLRDHPNIVAVFDIAEENGDPYIVSQLMEGGAVDSLLAEAEGHRFPIEEAIRIARDMCLALEHAHQNRIVHRDLKPGNVWLAGDGTARLGDFGLAVALDQSRLTQEGALVGTVAYIAPEQAVGTEPDARSDLYALGAMLYEMVTGRPPFLGDDAVTVVSQHINTPPVSPAWHNGEVSQALDGLILSLLEKDPERRPRSAAATAEALERIAKDAQQPAEASVAPDSAIPRVPWGRFVGRQSELDELKLHLEGALSGQGSLCMLVGEPGIGKSRLAEEFAVYARLRGAQVLRGCSFEGAVEVPYFPFVEAFRQYIGGRADDVLRSELGDGAPEVAGLVSEIRQRFPSVLQSTPLEGEAERARLFDSVTTFVRNAAAAQPIVIILDDLHWSDKPTLLMLRYLARNVPGYRILLVGAYRDVELDRTHPLAEILATLRREPFYHRVLLRGLPESDVVNWLSALAEDDADEEIMAARRGLAEALFRETEGNPFFISEVLTHLVEEGKLYRDGGHWRSNVNSASELGIPEGVREVVGRRLSRVSDTCNQMLTLASAMPAGFTWELLRALSDEEESTLLDSLDEALAARLVHERSGPGTATYEFTHALIRQTLYGELSAPRRVLLHRKIGERLEALYGEQPGPNLAVLAHHFFQAAPGGDIAKAIDYSVRTAERAAADCAYEEAVEHYARALQALELAAGDDPEQRCQLLLTLAETHTHAGTVDQAREFALVAAAIARDHGWRDPLALSALHLGGELVPSFIPDKERADLVEEALSGYKDEDHPLALRLWCRHANEFASADPEKARVSAARALEMAKRMGEPESLARAYYAAHSAHLAIEHLEERLEFAGALIEAAEEAGMDTLLTFGHARRFFDLLERGDASAAKRDLAAHNALAKRGREPVDLWQADGFDCLIALLEGNFEEAERLAEEAMARANRFEHSGGPTVYAIQKSRVRAERGELEENLAQVQAVNKIVPHVGWQARIAQTSAELGRVAEAREQFEKLAVDDFGTIPSDIVWLVTITYCAEVAAFLRDTERAATLYELILPHASRNIVVVTSACNGSVSRHLGLLATTLGRYEDAERHFVEAVDMAARLGSPPLAARAQCDYADLLLERAAAGDVEHARKLSGEALATARRHGMKVLAERALGLKLRAQGVDSADTQQSIYAVATEVERNQPDLGAHAAPDGTVTLMFSDMEGFTRMTERLGDIRAREVIRDHNRIVREQTQAHGGYEVELQGDGFLMAFGSARAGLQCAIGIQQAFAAHSQVHPEEPIRVRIGLHTGEALREAEKFFGRTVILAARIAAQAEGCEILASSLVRELTQSLGEIRFGAARVAELKGIAEPQQLVPVLWD
jgi:class 3 adenylate cyclase